jgi:CdiI immunity protein
MSRQEILDDPAGTCPQLHQFLGGYFHQDWALDRDSWQPVVEEFVTESPHSLVVETAAELSDVLAANISDAELTTLLDRLGASVAPAGFGMTVTAWLEALLLRLQSVR